METAHGRLEEEIVLLRHELRESASYLDLAAELAHTEENMAKMEEMQVSELTDMVVPLTEALEEAKADEARVRKLLAVAQDQADKAALRVAADMDSQIAQLRSAFLAVEKQNQELQEIVNQKEIAFLDVQRQLKVALVQKSESSGRPQATQEDLRPEVARLQAEVQRLKVDLVQSEARGAIKAIDATNDAKVSHLAPAEAAQVNEELEDLKEHVETLQIRNGRLLDEIAILRSRAEVDAPHWRSKLHQLGNQMQMILAPFRGAPLGERLVTVYDGIVECEDGLGSLGGAALREELGTLREAFAQQLSTLQEENAQLQEEVQRLKEKAFGEDAAALLREELQLRGELQLACQKENAQLREELQKLKAATCSNGSDAQQHLEESTQGASNQKDAADTACSNPAEAQDVSFDRRSTIQILEANA